MEEMSLETTKRLHRELWFWLENRPDAQKHHWPRWFERGGQYFSATHCFACDFSNAIKKEDCSFCPIKWSGGNCYHLVTRSDFYSFRGVFSVWDNPINPLKRKRLARAIRLMPWKDEIK